MEVEITSENVINFIHQIRNLLKYVSYKEQKALMTDLKKVYKALTIEEAEQAFEAFKEKWGKKESLIQI